MRVNAVAARVRGTRMKLRTKNQRFVVSFFTHGKWQDLSYTTSEKLVTLTVDQLRRDGRRVRIHRWENTSAEEIR